MVPVVSQVPARIVQTFNDKSGEKTFRASVTPGNAREDRSILRLRLLGDDFAILPDVDRRAVHARGLARRLGCTPERAADRKS